jgi:hypothetical protein
MGILVILHLTLVCVLGPRIAFILRRREYTGAALIYSYEPGKPDQSEAKQAQSHCQPIPSSGQPLPVRVTPELTTCSVDWWLMAGAGLF